MAVFCLELGEVGKTDTMFTFVSLCNHFTDFPNIFVSMVFWVYYLTEYPTKKIYDFKPILIMCYPKTALGSE